MQDYDKKLEEFIQTTCGQIKARSIHKSIIHELTDHIEEQKNEYMKQGLDEEAAGLKAIQQMGDPVQVGRELDKAHRPRIEWSILSLSFLLILTGGAIQLFLSGVNAQNADGFYYFLKYALIGIAAFACTYFFDYTLLGRFPKITYFFLFISAIAGFLFLAQSNGTYRHVYYLVLLFIPAFAGIIYGFRNRGYFGIIASGLFYAGPAFLCLLAPSLTSLAILTISCLLLLTIAIVNGFFGGNRKIGLAIVYVPTMMAVAVFSLFFLSSYRGERILLLFHPELDPQGGGFLHLLIKQVIAASRPFEEALFSGSFANLRVDQFLPSWNTDFSLTYIIARLGYITGLAIALVLFVLIVRIFFSILKQKNAFGLLISYASLIAITIQYLLYVLSNFGVIAPISVSLPFISFGGMEFVVNMILIGLVLSVYRRSDLVIDRLNMEKPDRQIVIFEDGKLIIDLGLKKPRRTS